jgi:hypothetical protein
MTTTATAPVMWNGTRALPAREDLRRPAVSAVGTATDAAWTVATSCARRFGLVVADGTPRVVRAAERS